MLSGVGGGDGSRQPLQGRKVGRDVFPDGSVRTPAGLDGHDAVLGQGALPHQKFGILLGKYVVGHDAQRHAVAERFGQLEGEGRLPAADGSADAHREASLAEVATGPRRLVSRLAIGVLPGPVEVGHVRSYRYR